ncbi:conserved hypothetical protein, partial [Ricinus communis]
WPGAPASAAYADRAMQHHRPLASIRPQAGPGNWNHSAKPPHRPSPSRGDHVTHRRGAFEAAIDRRHLRHHRSSGERPVADVGQVHHRGQHARHHGHARSHGHLGQHRQQPAGPAHAARGKAAAPPHFATAQFLLGEDEVFTGQGA